MDFFSIHLSIEKNLFIITSIQNGGERAISTMTFLKRSKSSEPFSREILDMEQKIKMILYLCTIGYRTTYGIEKKVLCTFEGTSSIFHQKITIKLIN